MGTCQLTNVCKLQRDPIEIVTNTQLNIIDQIHQDFVILEENKNVVDPVLGEITILDPIKESMQGFKLAYKVLKFQCKQEYKKVLTHYENRFYGLNHPNLLIIHAMQNKKVDEFFHTEYQIQLYMDYPARTFQREMILRQRTWFSDVEILYILDSCVGALAFLQSKGIAHQSLTFENIFVVILPNGIPCLKISDQMPHTPHYRRDSTVELPFYYSPEQLEGLRQDGKLVYNEFKSDVFTFGMMLVEVCTLSRCNFLYDDTSINIGSLNEHLAKVGDRYSEKIYELLKLMLRIQPKERPDFLELDDLISQNFPEIANKRISQTWQYADYQYCIYEKDKPRHTEKKRSSLLIHPDQHSRSSKKLNNHRSLAKQLSSIKQPNTEQIQSNMSAVQSNLSIFEQSNSPAHSIVSKKELLYDPPQSSHGNDSIRYPLSQFKQVF